MSWFDQLFGENDKDQSSQRSTRRRKSEATREEKHASFVQQSQDVYQRPRGKFRFPIEMHDEVVERHHQQADTTQTQDVTMHTQLHERRPSFTVDRQHRRHRGVQQARCYEQAVSDENVETEPTQEAEELSESQLKLVNDRVNEEMARRTKEMRQQIQDELTEKQKEADKLRKMNAEQKHQYELEKAEKERDDYKQQLESYKMRQEAMAMFNEAGMQAPESLLNMVVQDTAKATKEAVDSFVSMVNQEVQRQLESKATQNHVVGNHVTTPNNNKNTPQKVKLNSPF
ncbi:DUF4355 domain-containing protein [Staphylococcus pseudintermedius]|uniref:DUF4355 domain-containing protein n=2 Tax=Staphylococcus pseudintermedius TaxID=283734 RepID=UPI00286E75EA|nr:DUF4355 domain-containing protein [Staphylococcus pseudintermedius]WMZ78478.1 DUF4355 domain-containing protein [Staphylococcus pseudintermedius]